MRKPAQTAARRTFDRSLSEAEGSRSQPTGSSEAKAVARPKAHPLAWLRKPA